MKAKLFLFAALAAVTVFASCSKDDDDTAQVSRQTTGQEIKFQVGIENSKGTRAVPLTSSEYAKLMNHFSVFITNADDGSAFAGTGTNPLVFFNDAYKTGDFHKAGGQIDYYWPTTPLSFYAYYADPGKSATFGTSDDRTLKCDIVTKASGQTDVLYAKAENVSKDDNSGIVNLQFKHIFTQINFKVGKILADHEVKISEVGIAGIPSRATLDFLTGEVRTEGSQYYIVDDGACDAVEGKAVGSSLLVPEADVQDEWDPSDEHTHDFLYGYITVTCKVKNTKTGKYLVGSDSEFKTVYIPYTALFEAGKSYNFVLNFDGTNGFGYDEDGEPATRLIRYKVNVTDWQIAGDDNDAKVRI